MSEIGTFHWNELNTGDADAAMAFYAGIMGWTYQDISTAEGGAYWMAMSGDRPVAGILPLGEDNFGQPGDFWLPYLSVDNVDEKTRSAVEAGAEIVRPLWDVPDTGRRVVLRQPGGALVAWMTPFA